MSDVDAPRPPAWARHLTPSGRFSRRQAVRYAPEGGEPPVTGRAHGAPRLGDDMMGSQALLRDQVRTVMATEMAIAGSIDAQSDLVSSHADLHAELEALKGRGAELCQRLEEYLGEAEAGAVPAAPVSLLLSEALASGRLDRVLAADYATFALAAAEYSVLIELSLRLFDNPLRELAPRGLQSYAQAMRRLADLLPRVVVQDLDQHGLECRCICPMCGLGACGCTAAGGAWIGGIWQKAMAPGETEPGLVLSRPRAGSQLAENGVLAGERLVEVDGQRIENFMDVQQAIRAHPLGDEVTLLIARGSEAPRAVRVKHVSDY